MEIGGSIIKDFKIQEYNSKISFYSFGFNWGMRNQFIDAKESWKTK